MVNHKSVDSLNKIGWDKSNSIYQTIYYNCCICESSQVLKSDMQKDMVCEPTHSIVSDLVHDINSNANSCNHLAEFENNVFHVQECKDVEQSGDHNNNDDKQLFGHKCTRCVNNVQVIVAAQINLIYMCSHC